MKLQTKWLTTSILLISQLLLGSADLTPQVDDLPKNNIKILNDTDENVILNLRCEDSGKCKSRIEQYKIVPGDLAYFSRKAYDAISLKDDSGKTRQNISNLPESELGLTIIITGKIPEKEFLYKILFASEKKVAKEVSIEQQLREQLNRCQNENAKLRQKLDYFLTREAKPETIGIEI
jgi:predicted ribosome quality control (RQC) complex YloA/Tae2 family protein